jgi:hypothetical protein
MWARGARPHIAILNRVRNAINVSVLIAVAKAISIVWTVFLANPAKPARSAGFAGFAVMASEVHHNRV